VTLDGARRAARFPVKVPATLGTPEQVQIADPGPDGAPRVVTLFYRGGQIRIDEFDGRLDLGFIKTQYHDDWQWLDMDGRTALWFPSPHAIAYVDRNGVSRLETARLAGPTLVLDDGDATYRIEGVASLDDARAVAGSLRTVTN
jgi:hypothetical protein